MTVRRFDVAVVGGGINGAGVAQAAAAAGQDVLLLEKDAPGSGTSSKSSKLIHGGLRYLESFEFGLVRESLAERATLLRIAPELVRLVPFHIPVYAGTRRQPWLVRTGLSIYALLTGLSQDGRFDSLPRHEWETLDGLRTDDLKAVFRYMDGQTDDALLTRAVVNSARAMGAEVATPARFEGARLVDGGCELHYDDGRPQVAHARVLVNAAGPWVNEVLKAVEPTQQPRAVALVQGTHIDLDLTVHRGVYYVEAPRDGRAVFLIPRLTGGAYVGTTETRYRGNPDRVRPLASEIRYLLRVLKHYFPGLSHLSPEHVTGAWAGLRVLPAGDGHAFHRSRETVMLTDNDDRPRLLSVYGGKLTTYRTTALKVMQHLRPSLPDRRPRGDTATLRLDPPE